MQLGTYADSFRSYCMAFGGGFSACASAACCQLQPTKCNHEVTKTRRTHEEYGFLRGFVSAQKMRGRGRPMRRPGADPRVRPYNVSATTFSSYGVNPVS